MRKTRHVTAQTLRLAEKYAFKKTSFRACSRELKRGSVPTYTALLNATIELLKKERELNNSIKASSDRLLDTHKKALTKLEKAQEREEQMRKDIRSIPGWLRTLIASRLNRWV